MKEYILWKEWKTTDNGQLSSMTARIELLIRNEFLINTDDKKMSLSSEEFIEKVGQSIVDSINEVIKNRK